MATIAENIQTLRSIKSDIKNAITNKGVSVGNDFKTYAQAITNLPSGGGGNENLIDLIEGDITTLNIPDGATKICNYAFYTYERLTNVTIPDSVTEIGINAFYSCSALTDVTIGNGVTSIGKRAFQFSGLTNVTIPNSVTKIDERAFYSCFALTDVTIGSGVTSMGKFSFCDNSALTSVTILATTPPTLTSGVFDNTNNCPIYVPAESVNTYKTATNWSAYANRIQAIPTV